MKRFLLYFLFLLPLFALSQKQYPTDVEAVLKQAGSNRAELEKALNYFYHTADSLKIKAVHFLIANMDIHRSADYYWADSDGKQVVYNEFDHPDFDSSLAAFEIIKKRTPGIHPRKNIYKDIDSIKAEYLINNIEMAFRSWRSSPETKSIPFEDFCEYVLPYRISVEPMQSWRVIYTEKFKWIGDSINAKTYENSLYDIALNAKEWFSNTYEVEKRKEPLPRLGALHLLHRKKGACEDIAAMEVFALRSQGLPATIDFVPYWATSSGGHFFNSTFNRDKKPMTFDVLTSDMVNPTLKREPAKVLRTTYSKQEGTLASFVNENDIPDGFLRTRNYIDVTSTYWKTKDLKCKLYPVNSKAPVAYVCVFNYSGWKPTWWGKINGDSVTFTSLCKGAVFLPAYYINGRMIPAG